MNIACSIQYVGSNLHSCCNYFCTAYLAWSRFTLHIQVQVPISLSCYFDNPSLWSFDDVGLVFPLLYCFHLPMFPPWFCFFKSLRILKSFRISSLDFSIFIVKVSFIGIWNLLISFCPFLKKLEVAVSWKELRTEKKSVDVWVGWWGCVYPKIC